MSNLTKQELFKKTIQNRAYRNQILIEEHLNFKQIIQQIEQEHFKSQKKTFNSQQDQTKDAQDSESEQKESQVFNQWIKQFGQYLNEQCQLLKSEKFNNGISQIRAQQNYCINFFKGNHMN
ncbi:hypothetical protein ABPG72_009120 [Tetrahymena utriculariae]